MRAIRLGREAVALFLLLVACSTAATALIVPPLLSRFLTAAVLPLRRVYRVNPVDVIRSE